MIGVDVPAGTHELRLTYRTGWRTWLLFLAGVLVALAIDRWWVPSAGEAHAAEAAAP
jgi:hypothetical protein